MGMELLPSMAMLIRQGGQTQAPAWALALGVEALTAPQQLAEPVTEAVSTPRILHVIALWAAGAADHIKIF